MGCERAVGISVLFLMVLELAGAESVLGDTNGL